VKIFYASQHANHCPKQFYVWGSFVGVSPDLPERAENIRETLKADGHTILEAPDFGLQPIAGRVPDRTLHAADRTHRAGDSPVLDVSGF